jgi:hypothetical protein
VYYQHEVIQAEVGTAKASFKLLAKIFTNSATSTALAGLIVGATACLVIGVAAASGVPAMTALIAGLAAATGWWLLIDLARKRRSGQG